MGCIEKYPRWSSLELLLQCQLAGRRDKVLVGHFVCQWHYSLKKIFTGTTGLPGLVRIFAEVLWSMSYNVYGVLRNDYTAISWGSTQQSLSIVALKCSLKWVSLDKFRLTNLRASQKPVLGAPDGPLSCNVENSESPKTRSSRRIECPSLDPFSQIETS